MSGLDDNELQISRQFTYFMRIVRNVKKTTLLYAKFKRIKRLDWAVDPAFTAHNQAYTAWAQELPQDLQILYPSDGSVPWLPSTFIGNMHTYNQLSRIMHHRPQIDYLTSIGDKGWKMHMLLCHSAAKEMCRTQEAILQTDGVPGLLFMLRGISFTIYSILTCTMLHLVSHFNCVISLCQG